MNGALPPAELLRSAGAPHPAAEPDSSRLVYPTRLSIPQTWLYGLVEHPPLVVENLCGTRTEVVFTWCTICCAQNEIAEELELLFSVEDLKRSAFG